MPSLSTPVSSTVILSTQHFYFYSVLIQSHPPPLYLSIYSVPPTLTLVALYLFSPTHPDPCIYLFSPTHLPGISLFSPNELLVHPVLYMDFNSCSVYYQPNPNPNLNHTTNSTSSPTLLPILATINQSINQSIFIVTCRNAASP